MDSLGLEVGRGGGTRAPAVKGVVGLFTAVNKHTRTGQRQQESLFSAPKIMLVHHANIKPKKHLVGEQNNNILLQMETPKSTLKKWLQQEL